MDDNCIRKAWHELEILFGPSFYGQDTALKNRAQAYAECVLNENNKERIKNIGMRHLRLVANGLLEGQQFSAFLSHVIRYERFIK